MKNPNKYPINKLNNNFTISTLIITPIRTTLTLRLISHTTKSVTDISFRAPVPAIPFNKSSYICKSISTINCG